MDDNLGTVRLEFLHEFFTRLICDEYGRVSSLPLVSDMPYTLALLLYYNPGTLLAHVLLILTREAYCMTLVQNIPAQYPLVREWWGGFWRRKPMERLAIELYIGGRIRHFLSTMLMHWIKEGA